MCDKATTQEVLDIQRISGSILRRQYDPSDAPGTEIRHYHLTDAQFSSVALIGTGADPAVHERVRYAAYGKATHRFGGDLNDDGAVTVTGAGSDMALFLDAGHVGTIGDPTYDVALDLNRDGVVDAKDHDLVGPARAALLDGEISDRSGLAGGAPDNPVGYDGYLHNSENGLSTVRFRWYAPAWGRWLQRDPAHYLDGMSLYEFVRGNAISADDALGLAATEGDPPNTTCRQCGEEDLKDLFDLLEPVPGDPDANFGATEENRRYLREANEKINHTTRRVVVIGCAAALFTASFFVPGDELLWGPIFAKAGWAIKQGGKKVVDAAGKTVSRVRLKNALEKARLAWKNLDENDRKLICEAIERNKAGKTCSKQDGKAFLNRERSLPHSDDPEFYHEYHPAEGGHKCPERVIIGKDGSVHYFKKHPDSQVPRDPDCSVSESVLDQLRKEVVRGRER